MNQPPKETAASQLEKLFKECDLEGTGYLCQEGMRNLFARAGVCVQDADAIFENLDLDGDGRVKFEDISKGLLEFLSHSSNGHKEGSKTPDSEGEFIYDKKQQNTLQAWYNFATEVGKSDKIISEEKIYDLYKELQKSDRPQLIAQFEMIMNDLLENVKRLQEENNQLECSWKREKKEQELHLHRLEEEMTNQVQDLELKVKQKAQEEVEVERKNLKMKMDAEMDEIQAHLSLFEKVNSWLQSSSQHQHNDEKLNEVRNKLEEALHENHELRMSLMDTQTNIALMRSEMAQLRTQYEEKCRELSSERERIIEVLHEHDALGRQLHLLHDANKRLHDTNDSLREVMEGATPETPFSRVFLPSSAHRGSVIGDYLQNDCSLLLNARKRQSMDGEIIEEQKEEGSVDKEENRTKDDLDSGLSTLRDLSEELDEERPSSAITPIDRRSFSSVQVEHNLDYVSRKSEGRGRPARRVRSAGSGETSYKPSEIKESESEEGITPKRSIADIKRQLGLDPSKAGRPRSLTPSPVPTPRKTLGVVNKVARCSSSPPLDRKQETSPEMEENRKVFVDDEENSEGQAVEDQKDKYQATGPPERTYKVIFIGDAAVGKSSFILRLSKGVFVTQITSTVGVDFQIKTMNVDSKNVALQLWDTAGQERFRSITQSYFRKADGVMLLYDCTNEHSFLNVREWMEAVDVSCFYRMMAQTTSVHGSDVSNRKIPVMIVGNKTDLRDVMKMEGTVCISFEDGEKLAKDFGAIFMETSAKDGKNVFESIAELTRSMAINEDLQIKSSGLLLKEESKSNSKCCKK